MMNLVCILLTVIPLCMIRVTNCQTDTLSCDFEAGLCGYIQDPTELSDWILKMDGTPSSDTGPQFDHTLGTAAGTFLYYEASNRGQGDVARLTSPQYTPSTTQDHCLEFWTHMFGADIGAIYVFIIEGTSPSLAFTLSGDQGNVWTRQKATIPAGSNPISFVFVAERGPSILSDIAIDDILLVPGPCDPCVSCLNGATCIHDPNDSATIFECVCAIFFVGTFCETELNSCVPDQCLNGGTCIRSLVDATAFTCTCPFLFTGPLCGEVVDFCVELAACLNGATCISTPDDTTLYTCICPIGFTGQNCSIVVDACVDLSPCLNGATCITNPVDPTLYTCICTIGFTGPNCSIVVDACVDLTPCLNGATCITDSVNPTLYTCICPFGFTDPICATDLGVCVKLPPCLNGATCISNPEDPTLFTCICPIGFTDPICSTELDACDDSPCQNGGTCIVIPSDPTLFNCTCAQGFIGPLCDRDICYSGYVVRYGRCIPCPKGTYKNNALGDVTCKRCPPRYITSKIASRSIQYCKLIPCSGPLNLVIAVDVSNPFQLGLVQFWLSAFIKGFQIGPDSVRIGLLRFSDHVESVIPLQFGTSMARIHFKINQKLKPLPSTIVNTARALEAVFVELKAHHRPLVPSTALIITSHMSSLNTTSAVASILKAHGVYITAIGTSQTEIETLASAQHSQYLITGYEALPPRPEVLQSICG